MASSKLFEDIPPFPDDVPTAPLSTISLADLKSGDEHAAKRMLAECRNLGFFLLDLRGDRTGDAMTQDIDQLFAAGKEIMNLPEDVKLQYLHDIPRSFLGFKPRGQSKIETGEPDRFEWLNVGQDGLMGNTPLQPLPPLIHQHLPLFTSFLKHGHDIAKVVFSTIASQLGLPKDTFTSLQPVTKTSGTAVRLIRAFAYEPTEQNLKTSLMHHTDLGSATLLANVLGGLQILTPDGSPTDEDAWRWVRPQPHCLIVNMGDAMVQWTGGMLRSNVHRVKYAPGLQRSVDRYSLAIPFRPEYNATMRSKVGGENGDAEDGAMTAWEWEVKKLMSHVRKEAMVQSQVRKPLAS